MVINTQVWWHTNLYDPKPNLNLLHNTGISEELKKDADALFEQICHLGGAEKDSFTDGDLKMAAPIRNDGSKMYHAIDKQGTGAINLEMWSKYLEETHLKKGKLFVELGDTWLGMLIHDLRQNIADHDDKKEVVEYDPPLIMVQEERLKIVYALLSGLRGTDSFTKEELWQAQGSDMGLYSQIDKDGMGYITKNMWMDYWRRRYEQKGKKDTHKVDVYLKTYLDT